MRLILIVGASAITASAMAALAFRSSAPARAIDGEDAVQAAEGDMPLPHYASDGSLRRPVGYETWVLAGSSIGLGYSEGMAQEREPGMFHTVYISRPAYKHYASTGKFPEKTMMVMNLYAAGEKVAPSKQGYFQGDFLGMEAAVKDSERRPEGWAYYNFTRGMGTVVDSAQPFPKSACFSCHVAHAGKDNVFVQFYPLLRPQIGARAAADKRR
jgi:cytochrome P460